MRLLETIDSPADLKRLSVAQLSALAQEIREELLHTISTLGGHLASSLGAVELCLALHTAFEAPADQLVWDMGYQAYAHKLVTGRRRQIRTLKQFRGLTGFNNKEESPFDLFTTGHGGTCLSTAMGLAIGRDRSGGKHHVAAIIGDASLGEGMALEALNHIGHLKPNLLVILNDNKMSIAAPVGGLSRYLNRIITDPLYNRLRRKLERVVARLPKGDRLVQLGHKVEESLKGLLVPGLLFEELGFRYVGPIDGHNLNELIRTLRNLKRLKGPILLHVSTIKGKGYPPAERDPERFHKIEPFDLATGQLKTVSPLARWPVGALAHKETNAQTRKRANAQPLTFTEAFSEELVKLAQADERIIGITAAMPEGTGLAPFGRQFPGRYIDVGMAEQHALGLAAGLARAGRRPVVALYSTFLQRAYDQIMHELCLQNLPVVLAIDRGGLVGEDGPTHHGVFDIGYLRILPNLVVVSPKDPDELRAMLRWAVESSSAPVAIRYARGGIVCGEPLGKPARVSLGKAEVLCEGKDVALIALGSMVYPALEASTKLKAQGIDAAVVNARFVKPLDRVLLRQLATQLGALVILEEGQVAGGFGSAVSEALDAMGLSPVPVLRIGLPDHFVEQGTRAQLLALCQLDPDSVARTISAWMYTLKSPAEDSRLLADPTV
ncbi:MAG TPA: 1-deoxy-D-xylulose-5-phosphate synthase [Candidatus Omnitrophica bacterium]|nr:1-deoxy-D-xylulose-5-phosphate synthase [Candidatus Omnitrophota bacterium]HBH97266.1 1-deoxy-D-xylulose-5-phosphate synthase [Candidatus Omnitrophota bacterium]